MTILGPLLFAAFMVVPAWFATMEDTEKPLQWQTVTNIFTVLPKQNT
ncbi:MAG: hypothetical protein H6540_06590 [Bacteroidales bacterium]|nr:hypothetical protein [Bacteroidales bacterium]